MLHAQIATLHKQIPDPPALAKSIETTIDIVDLSRRLKESRLLKADWDPTKHPRWPAGSPGGIGGEFAPSTTTAGNSRTDEPALSPIAADDDNLLLIPAQVTIPFELPGETPFPSEVLPPPALPPNVSPLTIPRNPYPGRPKCVKEWAEATEDCLDLWANGLFGNDRYRGMGRTIAECIMGRVSQDCGGNRWDA